MQSKEGIKKIIEMNNDDSIVPIEKAIRREGFSEAYPIGYKVFDDAMKNGVRAGDLIVLTGISGHGKTTLAQNISVNLSSALMPSLWFSYEMIVENLHAKFKEMGAEDEDYLIYVPKRHSSGNISWIKEKVKESLEKYGTNFIFIDHIDFLSPTKTDQKEYQRRIILRDICQELKMLALELEVTIFLIAHVKKVQGREVEMQDIAESCLPAGSMILNADTGELMDIETVYNNNLRFNVVGIGENNYNQCVRPITDVICNGRREVFELAMSSGTKIRATKNHKFFNGLKWTCIKDLRCGDKVCVSSFVPGGTRKDISVEMSELIGWMLGDGSFTKYGTGTLTLCDGRDLSHIESLAHVVGVCVAHKRYSNWIEVKFQTRKNKYEKFNLGSAKNRERISKLNVRSKIQKGNVLKQTILDLGLSGVMGKDKHVPALLFSQNNSVVAALLRGLFQSDGSVSKSRYCITFANISEQLVMQIKHLLLRFGIRSRVCLQGRSGRGMSNPKRDWYPIFVLRVEGKESILLFDKHIGLSGVRGDKLNSLVKRVDSDTGKQLYNILPRRYRDDFLRIKRDNKITWKSLGFRIPNHQQLLRILVNN